MPTKYDDEMLRIPLDGEGVSEIARAQAVLDGQIATMAVKGYQPTHPFPDESRENGKLVAWFVTFRKETTQGQVLSEENGKFTLRIDGEETEFFFRPESAAESEALKAAMGRPRQSIPFVRRPGGGYAPDV